MPLTGDRALRPDTPWQRDTWMPAFLSALADEAADGLDRLVALERAWRAARRAVAGRRPAFPRRRRGGSPGRGTTRLGHLARRRPRHGGEERHAVAR